MDIMDNRENVPKLVKKAKEAIKRKESVVVGDMFSFNIYAAKVDVDVYLGMYSSEMTAWKITRNAILRELGYILVDINIDEIRNDVEERRGFHSVIHFLSLRKISDEGLNFIELLLGSDSMRYKINKRRIEKGISMEDASILFSQILERYKDEKSGATLALEEILGTIK